MLFFSLKKLFILVFFLVIMRLSTVISTCISLVLLLLPGVSSASASQSRQPPQLQQDRLRLVYQFPNETFLESIAVRANGQLLVTLSANTSIYLVNTTQVGPAKLIYHFTSVASVLGITETAPDVFALVAGNFSLKTGNTSGTYSVWRLDMNTTPPQVSLITRIPEAGFLNGISPTPEANIFLIADSMLGLAWRVNVKTGAYSIAVADPLMALPPNSTSPAGINGLHVFNSTLYFTNYATATFARIGITPNGSSAGSAAQAVAQAVPSGASYDDFAIDKYGNSWVATHQGNAVNLISPLGEQVNVAGNINSTEIAESTDAVFGRLPSDRNTLYVVTGGGARIPVNGYEVVGGQIVAIDTQER